jgi:hypothetical protein
MGLFELIHEHPDEVIVLDDLASVFKSDVALQLLLSALEHPTGRDRGRVVKYQRQGSEQRTVFRGGIICISNRELQDDELHEAFKSRVHMLNYDPSDEQLGALMLDIAGRGCGGVPPKEAKRVARYLLSNLIRLGCPFDLRLFVNKAIPIFQQWKDDETESDWRDLVTASIEERLIAVRHAAEPAPSRAARKEGEHTLVSEILREHPTREQQARAWSKLTGKSERAFYRRLAETH